METPMNTEIVTAEGTRPSYADHMSTQLGGDIEWMGVKARDLTRDELLSLVYNMDRVIDMLHDHHMHKQRAHVRR
jgi:hypothetical protein